MRWSSVALVFSLLFALGSIGCDPETFSTVLHIQMIFPADQNPLEEASSLRVRIVPEEEESEVEDLTQVILRPSSGWEGLSESIELGEVEYSAAQVVLEALTGDGFIIASGESIPIPIRSGSPGRVAVFFQEMGTSGSAPELGRGWSGHSAAYLEGGGVIFAGGEEGAASTEAWVYSVDVYEPIELASFDGPRSLVTMEPFGSRFALLIGGSQPADQALLYDPMADSWTGLLLPEEAQGSWPDPPATLLDDGGVIALRNRSVLRFSPGPPAAVAAIVELETDIEGAKIAAVLPELVLVVGDGVTPAMGIDPSRGELVEVSLPVGGGRTGHDIAVLSTGQVVIAGGGNESLSPDIELYSPEEDQWFLYSELLLGLERREASLLPLRDDRLCLVGGVDADGQGLSDAVLIDLDDASTEIIELTSVRMGHTATFLPTGAILIAGGEGEEGGTLDTVEVLRAPAEHI